MNERAEAARSDIRSVLTSAFPLEDATELLYGLQGALRVSGVMRAKAHYREVWPVGVDSALGRVST